MIKKNYLAYLYSIGGLVAVLFSFLITIEKFELIANPDHVPPCNISPFISCGTVMKTAQASLFGFPNSLIGIAGFAIIVTIGFALFSGGQFKRWFWVCTQIGLSLALIFIYWLFYQSVYVIGALCPYCMVVWAITIPLFLSTLVYNIQNQHITLGKSLGNLLSKYSWVILLLMYGVIIIAITEHFWFYWSTLGLR